MLVFGGNSVQGVINKSAAALAKLPVRNTYRGSMATITLNSVKGTFNLGCSNAALAWGATSNHSINATVLTGTQVGGLGTTKGVATQTNTAKIAQNSAFWASTLHANIQQVIAGKGYALNCMVMPLVKNQKANKAYRPCALYMQYTYNPNTNKLGLIVNYRAQHVYMLACNLQYHALQLLSACITHGVGVGNVTLVCNHHHCTAQHNANAVVSKAIKPWVAGVKGGMAALVSGNNAFYNVV
jgi:hypothetical protein